MRTIVFIGSQKSGSSREAIRAAEKLGFFTVVFTNRKRLLFQRAEFPEIHEMLFIDLQDKDAIREKIKFLQEQGKVIEAVVSFVDSYVHTAAVLCEEFCNKQLPIEAIYKMENKIETRFSLKQSDFNIKHAVYYGEEELDSFLKKQNLELPLIIKSPESTGSKDVLKADDEFKLRNNVERLQEKYSDTPILFEEFIDGPQYLVEVLVYNKKIYIVAVIEQEISKKQRFIVTGYSLLAKVPMSLYKSLYKTVRSILEMLEFTNGACHFELRRHDNQWKVIEINPRISGGAMNKMIEAAYGINLVEQTLKVWLGEEPCLEKKHEHFVFTQYITVSTKGTLQRVIGKKRALSYSGVQEVYIKPKKGDLLQPPLSMGHRYAYVIASSNTIENARTIARTAANEIKFYLQ